MKLHCSKILLFSLALNILITSSSKTHSENKQYITPHTTTTTSRVLSECDLYMPNYDDDVDMKSVKENFDRQTSQRFEEYEQRMITNRQKYKEQRDENIKKIIDKDKMDKSLAEKIEKGCLICGCGLGGVAASVGLFGGLGVYGWKSAAIAEVAKAKGAKAGMNLLICMLKEQLGISNVFDSSLGKFITTENYLNEFLIFESVQQQYKICFAEESACGNYVLFGHYNSGGKAQGIQTALNAAKISVGEAVEKAREMTISVTKSQMASLEADELSKVTTTSTQLYSAIGYSVLAILIIVLIMIIIYLVLRYRRKKKMNKKAQYTKLLNQ
ncbi:rifin [Plasmodium reichenowi]|uniref:Rifin n=1 Tax=Plasmodium reichenowi TaxID=5854 RepID=A0A060RMB5_PLARE|nr:rifin [Plasmodium reichenowi]